VFVTVDAAGTVAIPSDDEFPIIDASIATWNNAGGPSCSYLQIMSDARGALEVGSDGVNLIKFRDTTWGRPAAGNDPPRMYPPAAAGFTTLAYVDDGSARDGALLDADIEINGVNFAISVNGLTGSSQACRVELQNGLTHELGHLHGLEHTCLGGGDPPRLDNVGNPVPSCETTTDPRILDATMYNFQSCGETTKESLSPDDIQAKCDIYPCARDPGTCDRVGADLPSPGDDVFGGDGPGSSDGRGCCDSFTGADPGASMALAGLTLAWLKRRRATARSLRGGRIQ
jgi:MYXO-CTERM domain-containing protein